MKKILVILAFIALVCVSAFGYFIYSNPDQNPLEHESTTIETTAVETNLSMHFIDVGQGDATLVICDGEAMLIDAGDNTKGTTVQFYLKKAGVEKLKYFICTHPDADHIGGADVIVTKFDIDMILMPDVSVNSSAYRELMDAMEYRKYESTPPVAGSSFTLGNAAFTILGPVEKYSNENDNSIVIALKHGENSFILSGDAEETAELDIIKSGLDIDVDLYKAGHHGSVTSSSLKFLKAMSPKTVIISCGKDNTYGHPDSHTIEKIKTVGADIYRTDLQGTIVAFSDGKNMSFNTECWDEDSIQETTTVVYSYVCNKNTKRFHYLDCKSVKEMKDKNKLFVEATRDELIEEGFIPCGNCKP